MFTEVSLFIEGCRSAGSLTAQGYTSYISVIQ
jgi:hypothetical protein